MPVKNDAQCQQSDQHCRLQLSATIALTNGESTWCALNGGNGAGRGVPGECGGGGHPVEQRLGFPSHRVLLHVLNWAEKRDH